MKISWSARTDVGRFRKQNEDAHAIFACSGHDGVILADDGSCDLTDHDVVLLVSDGMGGANSGERASRIVVEEMARIIPQTFAMAAMQITPDYAGSLAEAAHAAHRQVNEVAAADPTAEGMGATLSLGWFTPQWLYFVHVGDSRIYYLSRHGRLIQLTHDHTRAGRLFREGKINEREARNHPMRSNLQQAIGTHAQFLAPQTGAVGFEAGDRFLFCTDGLTDGLWQKRMQQIWTNHAQDKNAAGAVNALMREALAESGRDNITIAQVIIN